MNLVRNSLWTQLLLYLVTLIILIFWISLYQPNCAITKNEIHKDEISTIVYNKIDSDLNNTDFMSTSYGKEYHHNLIAYLQKGYITTDENSNLIRIYVLWAEDKNKKSKQELIDRLLKETQR